MKVILAGIEYVGSTTISRMLSDWKLKNMGEPFFMGLIHDHSKLPHTSGHPDDTTLEEQKQILNLSPKLKEMYHRYGMYYHLHHYVQEDDLSVGFHIEEAVYARRYYGYGLDGEQFDRNNVFVSIENRIKQITTDPIITVHMVASPDIIESRMYALKDHPEHTNSPLQVEDIEDVMADYQYFISKSDIGPVVKVDTSIDSPEDTLEKVVTLLDPYFTKTDLERIESHKE
ncbi:MAG: hypothetical protein FI704_08125 [SAR202 cluster bacterium]|nr:hypothetical protein [SAR202 cluster bacterium]|tara:strand:- start:12551 stop:13237 length:687 start_codon:yes stop_codon:yes gene_type:complete